MVLSSNLQPHGGSYARARARGAEWQRVASGARSVADRVLIYFVCMCVCVLLE
eukprot:COSAG01_NODE_16_length_40091_cov_15.728646_36_plen_53_part_00